MKRLATTITCIGSLLSLLELPATAEEPWFERALVGMEVGPTGAQFGHSDRSDERYAAKFDGVEIVRRCAEAGAEYLVTWARDGDYAYYDSKLLPKAPGLGERDPLREAVAEARKRKMPLITYCVVQQGGHFLAEHPEFQMRDPEGKPIGRFCYNSGYLEPMKAILEEQLAYGIDGFHIDMLDQGFGPPHGCWCETCQRLFAEEHGKAMPKGVTWDEGWDAMLAFRYASSQRFEKALSDHIKALDPKATVDFNYHGNPPFSWEVGQRPVQHAAQGDFVTGETGVWGFSALTVGLNAEFYRAARPNTPFQVAMQRGVRMYHDQTTRPLTDLRWELLTLLSHGAFVTMIDKTAFDGGLDPVAYERMGAALKEARAKRKHFGHEPVCEVGIYFSSRSRDWIGRNDPGQWFQAFQGAHKACVYEHIGYGVVLDESVSLGRLKEFAVICMPGAGILSDQEIALLRRYVEGGGKLLITGQTGQFDQHGKPLAEPKLASLIGARVTGRSEVLDNWISLPNAKDAEPLVEGIRPDWPFLVKGPATIYEPVTARAIGTLFKPHRTTRQLEGKEGTDWPMSPDSAVGPAALLHKVGEGTVLTLSASPDFASASEHQIVEARRWFANAVRLLNPQPRLKITAPINVEAVVTEDRSARTVRVHLLGYHSPPQTTPPKNRPFAMPALLEDAPMYRVTIQSATPFRSAEPAGESTRLEVQGSAIKATIEDLHEVIVIRF